MEEPVAHARETRRGLGVTAGTARESAVQVADSMWE